MFLIDYFLSLGSNFYLSVYKSDVICVHLSTHMIATFHYFKSNMNNVLFAISLLTTRFAHKSLLKDTHHGRQECGQQSYGLGT